MVPVGVGEHEDGAACQFAEDDLRAVRTCECPSGFSPGGVVPWTISIGCRLPVAV